VIVERPSLERRVLASLDAQRIPVVLGGCGSGRTSLLLRLEGLIGRERAQYFDVAAAATTPERCLAAIRSATRFRTPHRPQTAEGSARTAVDAFFDDLDHGRAADNGAATFLFDEFLDVRTFESFPGLRHVQREFVTRLAASPSRFVLASRFTARVHRLLRDAPPRFEVVHVAPLDASEVQAMAGLYDGGRRDWAAPFAPMIAALGGGRAGPTNLLLASVASMGPAIDPVAALASLFAPDGALTARCRECYEFRLHRARGYGALKAILGVLAEQEPLNLTEIAQRLRRTPGSTKDYLSWLEDVDLITMQGKRYTYDDPLLRLYVRLYGHPQPPTDDEIVREVGGYARTRLPQSKDAAATVATTTPHSPAPAAVGAANDAGGDTERESGIIEID